MKRYSVGLWPPERCTSWPRISKLQRSGELAKSLARCRVFWKIAWINKSLKIFCKCSLFVRKKPQTGVPPWFAPRHPLERSAFLFLSWFQSLGEQDDRACHNQSNVTMNRTVPGWPFGRTRATIKANGVLQAQLVEEVKPRWLAFRCSAGCWNCLTGWYKIKLS